MVVNIGKRKSFQPQRTREYRLGWRGYALDRLQRKWNAVASSLGLGVIWAAWHMPIFFMRGSLLSEVLPLWSVQFWVSMGPGILATAVVMTWIYNNTRCSTLAAILFHFMMNFTFEFLRLPGDLNIYRVVDNNRDCGDHSLWTRYAQRQRIILPTKILRGYGDHLCGFRRSDDKRWVWQVNDIFICH